jgi:acyl phosphate:glycerol-3-phosphate acyltransferase
VDLFAVILPCLVAYLLGGIPFGLLIARAYGVTDIRLHGSGNIGATNVWRVAGPKAAIWVYAGDIGKGIIAVLIARLVDQQLISRDYLLVLAALFAVAGHVFPIYLAFHGGKGVNTALGVMLSLLPWHTLVALAAFILTVAASRYISLGSVVAGVCLFVTTLVEKLVVNPDRNIIYMIMTAVLMVLILYTHRTNMTRIAAGTESRFSLSNGGKSA